MEYFKGNQSEKINDELFKNPTCEYRGAPFWAWNSRLDPDQLCEQIDVFKEMGLGGFNMHVRQGLETPYLEKEFTDAVRACCEKAEKEGMYAWAYDEDRWPSGCVGGKLTKEMKYRLRYLLMTVTEKTEYTENLDKALNDGIPYHLGSFSVTVNDEGVMTSFVKLKDGESKENVRHFYCMTKTEGEPRFNYQTYADTMSKEAMDKFIAMTHEVYKREVGQYFGNALPAFFTDEPQVSRLAALPNGFSQNDAEMPFTLDLPESFKKEYGYDLIDRLPELFFASVSDTAKKTRYDYYGHVSERFASAFADNIGDWCENNGVMLSGHALGEDTLFEQVLAGYESMRLYKKMQLPGMDCLFADKNYVAALQCRSAVNQYGKAGMLSELYGVTNWDFDFRGHKFHGDWQACLGVSVRCQHLAWQSMKGEGKRDYPASIFYQSPWYKEYRYLEDHFARLNTVLTRGRCAARVALIHPLGTYWMEKAAVAETKNICDELDKRFSDLAYWLITGMTDFDYISESLLPDLCQKGSSPLKVGKMEYDAVVLCDCVTLRPHTLKVLEEFKAAGGEVIIVGRSPEMCDALPSERAVAFNGGCKAVPYEREAVRAALKPYTTVTVKDGNGAMTEHFIHTERIDGKRRWIFLTHCIEGELKQRAYGDALTVTVKGIFTPSIYDTVSGEIKKADYEHKNGNTVIYAYLYTYDTLLLALDEAEVAVSRTGADKEKFPIAELEYPHCVDYKLSEPNVLLLDMAEFSLDGDDFEPIEEIMRIDANVRARLGYIARKTKVVQPYVILDAPEDHTLTLRYNVQSEADFDNVAIALENAEKCVITLNGVTVPTEIDGWYIDKDIKTVKLGKIVSGENIIAVTMPLGVRTDLESAYLVGQFGVRCFGRTPVLCKLPEKLYFGDAVPQGLSFYGGNITYTAEIDLEEDRDLEAECTYYLGALVKVTLDGDQSRYIAYAPYRATFENVKRGKHILSFELFGNRYNTLSALHATVSEMFHLYNGPAYWRTEGDAFSYEYNFKRVGIMKAPTVRVLSTGKKQERQRPNPGYFFTKGTEWGKH